MLKIKWAGAKVGELCAVFMNRLVRIEMASHARVTGGIWVTQASIPTGIFEGTAE